MASQRLSRLQRAILAWIAQEDRRQRGMVLPSHRDLMRALLATRHVYKGNVHYSLVNLEVKGLIRLHRSPGGQAEAVELTAQGKTQASTLTASYD
jgi:DNA-binding MarR family transcriptional regulator